MVRPDRALRHAVLRRLPSKHPALVVSSFGRSGSTLIYRALVAAMGQARFGKTRGFLADTSWTLGEKKLRRGMVYKTHDYPDALADQTDARAVFVFGSASDAALSVVEQHDREGRAWIDAHFENLKAEGTYEDLLTRDVLGFGAQLRRWSTFAGAPVLCLRYEALWDHQDRLAEFTGLPVELPPRRARSEKSVSADVGQAVARVYGPIDAAIAKLPDAFEAGPDMERHLAPLDKLWAGEG
jgi:hypothetical protein